MSLPAWLDELDDGAYYEGCYGDDMFIEALEDGSFELEWKTEYDRAKRCSQMCG